MSSDWRYIDEYDKLPRAEEVFCDTRDFHILCTDDKESAYNHLRDLRRQVGYGTLSDCKYRRDEILGVLKTIEEESGGYRDWRCLYIKPINTWIKYIRFIRLNEEVNADMLRAGEAVYLAYTGGQNEPVTLLPRRVLLEPEVDETLL